MCIKCIMLEGAEGEVFVLENQTSLPVSHAPLFASLCVYHDHNRLFFINKTIFMRQEALYIPG